MGHLTKVVMCGSGQKIDSLGRLDLEGLEEALGVILIMVLTQ